MRVGLLLGISGAILAPVFYFIVTSVPLAALGISMIIIGTVCVALGNARPDISPEASQMMLETGMENVAALLEELGLRSRAVYIPHSSRDVRPKALIPLNENRALSKTIPTANRLIVRYGPNPEDICLSVVSPGAVSLRAWSKAIRLALSN